MEDKGLDLGKKKKKKKKRKECAWPKPGHLPWSIPLKSTSLGVQLGQACFFWFISFAHTWR